MKRRHAAALVLVGWYLMLPPFNLDKAPWIDDKAPLSKWTIKASTDSALECAEIRNHEQESASTEYQKYLAAGQHTPLNVATTFMDSLSAQCVATDDPRLAK